MSAKYRRIRAARFVRTWKMCCGASAITANTRSIASSDSDSWNRSDMLLTNIRRGRLPPQRQVQHVGDKLDPAGPLRPRPGRISEPVVRLAGAAEPRRHRFGVAVAAALGDARAAAHRVPRVIAPLDAELYATAGVLPVVVAPRADSLHVKLVVAVVSGRVVILVPICAGENGVGTIHAGQAVRMLDASRSIK